MSDLQVQFDNLTSRLSAAESSHHALQRSYNDVTQRLAEAHANIARLTSVAAERKTSTALELNRLMDENRILEKRGDDARQAILDREAELERITDSYAEKERQWEDKWKKEERVRREAEKRAEDLKVVVDRLAMASGEGNGISPAAALANGARTGGKTYTQFYMDYTLLDGKLRASENEVSRLTQILDEISADLAEKVSRPFYGAGIESAADLSSNRCWTSNRLSVMPPLSDRLPSPPSSQPSWLLETPTRQRPSHWLLQPCITRKKSPPSAPRPTISLGKSKAFFVSSPFVTIRLSPTQLSMHPHLQRAI